MNEFVNRQFEIRDSYEINAFVERAEKLLPPATEPGGARVLTWVTFDTDPSKRLRLQLGMGPNTNLQDSWLCASEQPANPTENYVNCIKYLVGIENRTFLTKPQRISVTSTPQDSIDTPDVVKMELSLGMYVPAPTDWDRFSWIIDQAQEFTLRKKGAELAQLTKSVENLVNNTEELS